MKITPRRISGGSGGYTYLSGEGKCQWAYVPEWPCGADMICAHAAVGASDEFIESAAALSAQLSAAMAVTQESLPL